LADLAGVAEEGTHGCGYILPTDKVLHETMPDGHVFSYEPAVLVKARGEREKGDSLLFFL
jgi:hypothetical protein